MSIFRAIVRILSLVFLVGFVLLCIGTYIFSCAITSHNPPAIKDAPWAVQTSSRIYYGKEYSIVNGNPALIGYWTLDGKGNYHFYKGTMEFPKKLFGQVAIIRRTE